MSTYTIKKGRHYSKLGVQPVLDFDYIAHIVKFDDTARYNLGTPDQFDINKLFGVGFLHHHYDSARFGWRYIPDLDKIELLAYMYKSGTRINEWDEQIHLCLIDIGKKYELSLHVEKENYRFIVWDIRMNTKVCNKIFSRPKIFKWFGYLLRPYFGGNRTAPHDINIFID